MIINEIIDSSYDIEFTNNAFIGHPVPKEFTEKFLKSGLFVDEKQKLFRGWWQDPGNNISSNGALFAMAQHNGKYIGVGVLEMSTDSRPLTLNRLPGFEFYVFGSLGFFVKTGYRNQQIAQQLLNMLDEMITKAVPWEEERIGAVSCSNATVDLIQKFSKNFISYGDLTKELDTVRNNE